MIHSTKSITNHFIPFFSDLSDISLPEYFPDPFHPVPHELAVRAALELQKFLTEKAHLKHNFGLENQENGLGKMFGVLVVRNSEGKVGYLAAFSGKLEDGTITEAFVPPVFDTLAETGFYRLGEREITLVNHEILRLENEVEFRFQKQILKDLQERSVLHVEFLKSKQAIAKKLRAEKRIEIYASVIEQDRNELLKSLETESISDHYLLKKTKKYYAQRIEKTCQTLHAMEAPIKTLRLLRKQKSAILQNLLFKNYRFLNKAKEEKSLFDLFCQQPTETPPSGAGECTAPKLLQYAFQNELTPVALAEFWWGKSPDSEIRKHKQFYAACNSKCRPILTHMLSGMLKNPIESYLKSVNDSFFQILWEDEDVMVIRKEAGVLSVPGKSPLKSVYSRIRELLPNATGPLLVHRLDMSTSGIMLVAKTKYAHKILQQQFADKSVQKTYTALIYGAPGDEQGQINLPLRVDLEDRPRQMVCFQYGKSARTRWKVVERNDPYTRILFFPETGRTHQLRVHAAHRDGLNAPIRGDDLYGNAEDRLYLHASAIIFRHPISGKKMYFSDPAPF